MDYLDNLDSVHQLQAVQRALISIQQEQEFSQEQVNGIEKYFHYLYSIGFYAGSRNTSHRKRVIQIIENSKPIIYPSSTHAALAIGVEKKFLSKCIIANKKCKGFIFTYEK